MEMQSNVNILKHVAVKLSIGALIGFDATRVMHYFD